MCGMTEASTTRRPSMPRTRRRSSTTARDRCRCPSCACRRGGRWSCRCRRRRAPGRSSLGRCIPGRYSSGGSARAPARRQMRRVSSHAVAATCRSSVDEIVRLDRRARARIGGADAHRAAARRPEVADADAVKAGKECSGSPNLSRDSGWMWYCRLARRVRDRAARTRRPATAPWSAGRAGTACSCRPCRRFASNERSMLVERRTPVTL